MLLLVAVGVVVAVVVGVAAAAPGVVAVAVAGGAVSGITYTALRAAANTVSEIPEGLWDCLLLAKVARASLV